MAEVTRLIGAPAAIADFGDDFRSWQYRLGGVDTHDYSHYLVFRRSTGRLVSVTRSYEPEQAVDAMFPAAETMVVLAPGADQARYGARVRRLKDNRLLIAMGSIQAGQPTGQLILVHAGELRNFFPWIADHAGAAGDPTRPRRSSGTGGAQSSASRGAFPAH
jgi:hypothetical protein